MVWELPFGEGHRWLSNASPLVEALLGGWTLSGINTMTSGEAVNLTYAPATSFIVSGINQTFRGANNYRPNVSGDPYGDKSAVVGYLNGANVTLPTDPSQPFGNAAPIPAPSSAWKRSTCSIARTSADRTGTAAPRLSGGSPRPTTRASCSSV
ncbi:MAG: hypothetical protein H0W53_16605 [Acidobacteria bacterium]|nr:hypothetical protein [Acidobacteriota bacterium]